MDDANHPDPPDEGKAPRALRKDVNARIGLRKRGYSQSKVDLLNISKSGFKIETGLQLAEGEQVFLNLPGLETRVARVAWTDKFTAGCEFDQPLADYVFDQIVARLK